VDAEEEPVFGSKAVGLGAAARGGLPLPPGVALAGSIVEEVASGEAAAIDQVAEAVRSLPLPLAVRSSAVDEDGAEASFAGQHITLLNVRTVEEVGDAVRAIWWSANSDSAITYRQRVGLFHRPSVGVVVQSLLDPAVAGVMFTQNPVNGADERMIEASWGLGEAVVAGQVIPDSYRVARSGQILERRPGLKKVAIRPLPDGGTFQESLPAELVEKLCLTDQELAALHGLATRCEEVYGRGRDIEWAIADGELYLLQCRAITRAGEITGPQGQRVGPAVETVQQVPLFADLGQDDLEKVAQLFKKRRFSAGEIVTKEGSGAGAFYLIESGEAEVTVSGKTRATLTAGAHFGEVALIDGKQRTATITATSDLVCYGLTCWDFQPLVQKNAAIAWVLLQSVTKMLRAAQDDQRRD
jgi:pyruvate,water dikinase